MNTAVRDIFEFLRLNFFYDIKSSIVSLSFLFAIFFLTKLMKDKGDVVLKTLKYLTCLIVSFGIVLILN